MRAVPVYPCELRDRTDDAESQYVPPPLVPPCTVDTVTSLEVIPAPVSVMLKHPDMALFILRAMLTAPLTYDTASVALLDATPSDTVTRRLRQVPCTDRLVTQLSESQTLADDAVLAKRKDEVLSSKLSPKPSTVMLTDPVAAMLPLLTALADAESLENIRVEV